ncbi:MAG: hypothetical protein RL318_1309 [Fibrobacterota bacterium]|jgi:hypothetical protein
MQEHDPKDSNEEIPPPEEGKKMEAFGLSDVVTLLVIALVAGGFWWWYQSAKQESNQRFQAADDLWSRKDYRSAKKAYETLQEKSHFVSKENDTLMTHRLGRIGEWEESARILEEGVKAAVISADTGVLAQARAGVLADTNAFVEKNRLLATIDSATKKEK